MARWTPTGRSYQHPATDLPALHLTKPPRAGIEELPLDHNGCPMERTWIDGQETIIHYDALPPQDLTVIDGIPCTTALRTIIDVALTVDPLDLELMVAEALLRGLFSFDEAAARLREPDMAARPGAVLVGRVLQRRRR